MTKREFNKILRECSSKGKNGKLITEKVKALPEDVKEKMVHFLVRHRAPIVEEFIGTIDRSWLYCCGYGYKSTNKAGFTFVHTCEHSIK